MTSEYEDDVQQHRALSEPLREGGIWCIEDTTTITQSPSESANGVGHPTVDAVDLHLE